MKKIIILSIALSLTSCDRYSHSYQGFAEADYTYISTPIAGALKTLAVVRGQTISKDQLLFALDLAPESDALTQAQAEFAAAQQRLRDLQLGERDTRIAAIEAQIDRAKSNLQLAQVRLARAKQLVFKNALERDKLDDAINNDVSAQQQLNELEANLREAKLGGREHAIAALAANVSAAQAKVKQVEWQVAQKTFRAPFNGSVTDTYFTQGEYVNAGRAVMSLLNPDNVHVVFFVPATQISSIKLGDTVTVICTGCHAQSAVVNFISPKAEFTPPLVYSKDNEYNVTFRVQAKPVTPATLHPGQPLRVAQ